RAGVPNLRTRDGASAAPVDPGRPQRLTPGEGTSRIAALHADAAVAALLGRTHPRGRVAHPLTAARRGDDRAPGDLQGAGRRAHEPERTIAVPADLGRSANGTICLVVS